MAETDFTIDLDMGLFDDLTMFGLTSPSGADVRGYVRVSCTDAINEIADEWIRMQNLLVRDVMPDEIDEDPISDVVALGA